MNHAEFFKQAVEIIEGRDDSYGSPEAGMKLAAEIFERVTGVALTEWHVAMLLHSVKLARIRTSPGKLDHYLDGAAYLSFAALSAESKTDLATATTTTNGVAVPGIDWSRGRDD